jgi:hypothetical protein
VYVGHSCKSLMNASNAHYKFSTIEKNMNRMVKYVFVMLFALSILCALYYAVWLWIHENELPYLHF